jgi:hypothetical protein
MLPRIIAICGAKRSGKDTVARMICELEHEYVHVKFSSALKDVCKVLFGFTDDQLELDLKEDIDPRWGVSPRQMMQYLGTEVMQHELPSAFPQMSLGRTFWIKRTMDAMSPDKKYVISDLRFLHEESLLRDHGAYIIKVDRGGAGVTDNHSSEQEFKDIHEDVFIENNSLDMQELREIIKQLLEHRQR